jgi:RNA-directed DNA polymerase
MLEEILSRTNMLQAYARVISNQGSPGVDKMPVESLHEHVKHNWISIRKQIEISTYIPSAIRTVEIPKPNGGVRLLGIPTVSDRLIQQAIAQVLIRYYDSRFSENSYGFRPSRSAHQAVVKTQRYLNEGYTHVIELDLEKFFDKVNHDKLMTLLSYQIKDKSLLKLIRRYLRSGIMDGGLIQVRTEGTPQGSPLSPILSNILLDELDKELERRGLRFVRYADDVSIYVKSSRSAERVQRSIIAYIENVLILKVNKEKSRISRPSKSNLLGFTFGKRDSLWRPYVSPKSKQRLKGKIKSITGRSISMNIKVRLSKLSQTTIGWCNYFKLADCGSFLKELDKWIRFRIRMCLWKSWKVPQKRIRELVKLGIEKWKAYRNGNTRKGYCRIAHSGILQGALTNTVLERLGFQPLFGYYNSRHV